MNPRETVRLFMEALQAGKFEQARALVASDEFFCAPTLSIIGMVLACPWMEIGARLKAAFPDLDYRFMIEGVNGDSVRFSTRLRGTHTGELDLTVLKMGVIPATHRPIFSGREYGLSTVHEGRIISWAMESMHCINLFTLLEQLNIRPELVRAG